MESDQYDYLFKIAIIGACHSGKSSLLARYADGSFSDEYTCTIGVDFRIHTVGLDGCRVKLQIWDTVDAERPFVVYYRGAMGVMVLFDVTSAESFRRADRFFGHIVQHASEDVRLLLVGCKSDLVLSRKVSFEEALEKAQKYNTAYVETSAKTGDGVYEAFETLARMILPATHVVHIAVPRPAPVTAAGEEEEAAESVRGQIDTLKKRLEAVRKLVRILGDRESSMVKSIRKVLSAPSGKRLLVDEHGGVKVCDTIRPYL